MSHTLHRQGTPDDLRQDFIVFSMSAKEINHVGSASKLAEFLRVAKKYEPVNLGDMKTGNMQKIDVDHIIESVQDTSIVHAVFTDPGSVASMLAELREKDLGISVIVSGLFGEVGKCIEAAGVEQHTKEHSLGIKGRTELLPDKEVMRVSTMCGHGMVSASQVLKAVRDLKRKKGDAQSVADKLARPCECGVFNPARAAVLLCELAAIMTFDW
jgi:hypothetical protein